MDNDKLEKLSALVDGELAADQTEDVIGALVRDARMRAKVTQYRRIGEAMRSTYRGSGFPVESGLSGHVMRMVERESAPAPGPHRTTITRSPPVRIGRPAARRHAFRPAARVTAVAAALVIAGVLGFVVARQVPEPMPDRVAHLEENPGVPGSATAAVDRIDQRVVLVRAQPRRGDWAEEDPSVQQRLRGYLVNHSEYVGRGVRGLHPYARVVSYAGTQ